MPNTSTLEENKLTPTIEDIRADYEEVVALLQDVTDIEELRRIAKRERLTIEINGMEDYDGNWEQISEIEYIRVNAFHWLDYIYFWYDGVKKVYFDVWSEDAFEDFITDITIENLETAYEKGIEWLNSISK